MKKIALIGAVNTGNKPNGGEEYKNQLLRSYLASNYDLEIIDTYHWQSNPSILINLFYSLIFIKLEYIIISASSLSTYRLLKFIYYVFPKLKIKIIYSVIGGYYPEGVRDGYYKKKYYENIRYILVEGNNLRDILAHSGLKQNVMVVPNYKPIENVWIEHKGLVVNKNRFVFISSISREKGVTTIFDAVEYLLKQNPLENFTIDFFGPIEVNYKREFEDKLKLYHKYCRYLGYLDIMGDPQGSYEKLAEYSAMLFPTVYKGEGFPGVILDAYIAGLPVIASDWHMNNEVVRHGETGLLVTPDSPKQLAEAMQWTMTNPEKVLTMRSNSRKLAASYDVKWVLDNYLKPILSI